MRPDSGAGPPGVHPGICWAHPTSLLWPVVLGFFQAWPPLLGLNGRSLTLSIVCGLARGQRRSSFLCPPCLLQEALQGTALSSLAHLTENTGLLLRCNTCSRGHTDASHLCRTPRVGSVVSSLYPGAQHR